MLTYGIIMTWLVGFIMGAIVILAIGVWMDGRDEKRIQQERDARRARLSEGQMNEDDSAAMDEAVALVSDKLGGTVLNYDNVD